MTLLPLMQFIFDTDWPTSDSAVFMTPTFVWGPLVVGLLAFIFFAPFWVALVGIAATGIQLWVDPKYHESVQWEEVMDTDG